MEGSQPAERTPDEVTALLFKIRRNDYCNKSQVSKGKLYWFPLHDRARLKRHLAFAK